MSQCLQECLCSRREWGARGSPTGRSPWVRKTHQFEPCPDRGGLRDSPSPDPEATSGWALVGRGLCRASQILWLSRGLQSRNRAASKRWAEWSLGVPGGGLPGGSGLWGVTVMPPFPIVPLLFRPPYHMTLSCSTCMPVSPVILKQAAHRSPPVRATTSHLTVPGSQECRGPELGGSGSGSLTGLARVAVSSEASTGAGKPSPSPLAWPLAASAPAGWRLAALSFAWWPLHQHSCRWPLAFPRM